MAPDKEYCQCQGCPNNEEPTVRHDAPDGQSPLTAMTAVGSGQKSFAIAG